MERNIAVVGFGDVGVPGAVAFAWRHKAVGFDIGLSRVADLRVGLTRTAEISSAIEVTAAAGLNWNFYRVDPAWVSTR